MSAETSTSTASALQRVNNLAVEDFAWFVFIHVYMIKNDEKANQVPVFILQDKQAYNYHYYLDIEPLNPCVLSFVKMFNLVCDVVAWCFKYKTFYMGMSCINECNLNWES